MKRILIYSDIGVSRYSKTVLPKSLKEVFASQKEDAVISFVTAKDVKSASCFKDASMFIMPGGADIYYCRKLNGLCNKNIRAFVENGGFYLGLCAGAYYACDSIEWYKGTEEEIIEERELKFFNATAVGPVFKPYIHRSEKGCRACLVEDLNKKEYCVYYNGGCAFYPKNNEKFKAIAFYKELPSKPLAIISKNIGKGKVLLSGVHIEILGRFLPPNSKRDKNTDEKLRKADKEQMELWKRCVG
ncbi:MAG: hypothetical protein D6780_08485, partial [Candidatus Dadabacteria bacterium]